MEINFEIETKQPKAEEVKTVATTEKDLMPIIKKLMQEKDEMEKEIKKAQGFFGNQTNAIDYLNSQGLGLKGGLVDKDGFPLADVNKVLAVREARNKIASN
jgi:hypothetical protein